MSKVEGMVEGKAGGREGGRGSVRGTVVHLGEGGRVEMNIQAIYVSLKAHPQKSSSKQVIGAKAS